MAVIIGVIKKDLPMQTASSYKARMSYSVLLGNVNFHVINIACRDRFGFFSARPRRTKEATPLASYAIPADAFHT